MAKATGVALDALGGLSAAATDPERGRLLAQLAERPEPVRAAARPMLAGLLRLNGK